MSFPTGSPSQSNATTPPPQQEQPSNPGSWVDWPHVNDNWHADPNHTWGEVEDPIERDGRYAYQLPFNGPFHQHPNYRQFPDRIYGIYPAYDADWDEFYNPVTWGYLVSPPHSPLLTPPPPVIMNPEGYWVAVCSYYFIYFLCLTYHYLLAGLGKLRAPKRGARRRSRPPPSKRRRRPRRARDG